MFTFPLHLSLMLPLAFTAPSSRVNLYTHVCYICNVLAISKKPYLSDRHNKCDLEFHFSSGTLPASQSLSHRPVAPSDPEQPFSTGIPGLLPNLTLIWAELIYA